MKSGWRMTDDCGTQKVSLKNKWVIIHVQRKPFLSLPNMQKKNLYACDQQNAWNENPNPVLAQALNSPGHEPKPGWVMERDTPHRHTELRCIMTTSSCLTSPVTSHIDPSFPSPAFSTTRVPPLNPWDYPAGVELSVPWFQPKPPSKALVRLYDFSKWIQSYREESDTFTGPEAAQLCWVHTAPSLDAS